MSRRVPYGAAVVKREQMRDILQYKRFRSRGCKQTRYLEEQVSAKERREEKKSRNQEIKKERKIKERKTERDRSVQEKGSQAPKVGNKHIHTEQ